MSHDPWELLRRTREYIAGCGKPSDEPCDCAECEAATALLVEVDAALDRTTHD